MATSRIKSTHQSPLRDKFLSNSPDPIKSSIIRDSGLGWISPAHDTDGTDTVPLGSTISPLRISKRESPGFIPRLARRSSSSYKHVTRNNLVSKSPFKLQQPSPASSPKNGPSFPLSRKVSGEKRPRPPSMHEQAEDENSRPISLKRERRQSRGFQGLIQKEPVTKSPFRQRTPSADEPPSASSPPGIIDLSGDCHFLSTSSLVSSDPSTLHVPPLENSSPRPSLVSRRMRGPRLSKSIKGERRKTVTWDERCDVVEFDREEVSDDVISEVDQGADYFGISSEHEVQDHSSAGEETPLNFSDSHSHGIPFQPDAITDMSSLTTTLEQDGEQERRASIETHLDEGHTFDFSPETSEINPLEKSHPTDLTHPLVSRSFEDKQSFSRMQHATTSSVCDSPTRMPSAPLVSSLHTQSSPQSHEDSSIPTPGPFSVSPRISSPGSPYILPSEGLHDSKRTVGGHPSDNDPLNGPALLCSSLAEDSFPHHAETSLEDFNPASLTEVAIEDPSSHENWNSSFASLNTIDDYVNENAAEGYGLVYDTSVDNYIENSNMSGACGEEDNRFLINVSHQTQGQNSIQIMNKHAERSEQPDAENRQICSSERDNRLQGDSSPLSNDVRSISVARSIVERENQKCHDDKSEIPPTLRTPETRAERINFTCKEDRSSLDHGGAGIFEAVYSWRLDKKVDFGHPTDDLTMNSSSCLKRDEDISKVKFTDVDLDVDMRSALDRLMDDVAGTKMEPTAAVENRGLFQSNSNTSLNHESEPADSALLHHGFLSRDASLSSSTSTPPPLPPKDNIKSLENVDVQGVDDNSDDEETLRKLGPRMRTGGKGRHVHELLGVGRPSRRRSLSAGDVDSRISRTPATVLEFAGFGDTKGTDEHFGVSIEKELQMKLENVSGKSHKMGYFVRQRQGTIYASSSDSDGISHMAGPGDVDAGKAWRAVRRPSDMNEYSEQIKEYKAQVKQGKAFGKVFVKVIGVKGVHVPIPEQPTALTCTLNNGIHFVSTPESQLGRDFSIEQEFELIEHNKLEFTLTLKVRRDPHIVQEFKALSSPVSLPPVPPPVVQTTSKSGMLSFFSSSPKKSSRDKMPPQPLVASPSPTHRLTENLARYLKPDGTLARAFISFKDVASRCDARLFETSYPLIGQRVELGGKYSTLQVGEIVLQMFRLPPLPGISSDQLPQSLEECHRGLRHINWHKMTYFEGTLTQLGGDCSTWRRRRLRVIGSNLVAFNDITKKATVAIDLKKATAVEDDQELHKKALSRSSGISSGISRYDEYGGLYGVERSFRLTFPRGQEIVFFADTDEEKSRWLDVLRALVGHIPPHPLWAEFLWQRQEEQGKEAHPCQTESSPSPLESRAPQSAERPQTQSAPSWLLPKASRR